MKPADKHYYRAAIYYLAEVYEEAAWECYQVLKYIPLHGPAQLLLVAIKKQSRSAQKSSSNPSSMLIRLLEAEDLDRFLILLFAEYDLDNFRVSQVDWLTLEEFKHSEKAIDRIWRSFLKKDWHNSFSLCQSFFLETQGNPTVYFQIAYTYYQLKDFFQAEPYFFLLAKFGGIYTLAAAHMLLKLPQHQFRSLSSCPEIMSAANKETKFALAELLQKSWDEKACRKFLTKLYFHIKKEEDYLPLGEIYLKQGWWWRGKRILLKQMDFDKVEKMEEIADLILRYSPLNPPFHLRSLVKKLSLKSNFFGEKFSEDNPPLSLLAYQQQSKQEPSEENFLGQAEAYYFLGEYKKAEKLFSKLEYKKEKAVCGRAWTLYRQNPKKGGIALRYLEKMTSHYPSSEQIQETYARIADSFCPNCQALIEEEKTCSCPGQILRFFQWEKKALRWQEKKLFFPSILASVTSDKLVYEEEEYVHFFLFSSAHVDLDLQCWRGDQLLWRKKNCWQGIITLSENDFTSGVYRIILSYESALLSEHFFLVSDKNASFFMEQDHFYEQEKKQLQIRISLTEIEEKVPLIASFQATLYDMSSGQKVYFMGETDSDGKADLTFALPLFSEKYLLFSLQTAFEGSNWSLISLYSLNNENSSNSLNDSDHSNQESQFFSPPEKEKRFSLSLEKNEVVFTSIKEQDELVLGFQPQGNASVQIFREKSSQKSYRFPLAFPLSAYYLASVKKTSCGLRMRDYETFGLIWQSLPPCSWKVPSLVYPGEKFSFTLSSSINLSGVLVFKKFTGSTNTLQKKLSHQGQLMVSGQEILLLSPRQELSTLFCSSPQKESTIHFLTIEKEALEKEVEITLRAEEEPGKYELLCFLSDGCQLIEKQTLIEVAPPQRIQGYVPKKIGERDKVVLELSFFTQKPVWLKVRRFPTNESITGKEVESFTRENFSLQTGENLEVIFGGAKESYFLSSLEKGRVQKNHLQIWEAGKNLADFWGEIYLNPYLLVQNLLQGIIEDKSQDTETSAARLYAYSRLFSLIMEKKILGELDSIEKSIEEEQKLLCGLETSFQGYLWGYFPQGKADRQVSLEVLHHLAPFLEMPRFQIIYQLAERLMQKLINKGFKDNRLVFLSPLFQESRIKSPESAAALWLLDLKSKQAQKYIERKAQKGEEGVFWEGSSLGGVEQTSALVAQALWRHKHPLALEAIAFLGKRVFDFSLSSPAATIAMVELILETSKSCPKSLFKNTHDFPASRPFSPVDYPVWTEKPSSIEKMLLPEIYRPLKVYVPKNIEKNHSLKRGESFSFLVDSKKVSYPQLELFIPPHIIIFDEEKRYSGYHIYRSPALQIQIQGKSILLGEGYLEIVLRNRYQPHICFRKSIYLKVEARK